MPTVFVWIYTAGGPPGALNPRINLEVGGPSRLPLAGWGFSVSGPAGPTYLSPAIHRWENE